MIRDESMSGGLKEVEGVRRAFIYRSWNSPARASLRLGKAKAGRVREYLGSLVHCGSEKVGPGSAYPEHIHLVGGRTNNRFSTCKDFNGGEIKNVRYILSVY